MTYDHMPSVLASLAVSVVAGAQSALANEAAGVSFNAWSTFGTVAISAIISFTVLRVTVRYLEKDLASLREEMKSTRVDLTGLGREVSEVRGQIKAA